jgi:hypothetical protein
MKKLFTLIMMLLMFGCSGDDPISGGTDPEPELIGCEAATMYDWDAIEFETSLDGGADTWIAFSLEELTYFTVVISQAGFQVSVFAGCDGEYGADEPLFVFETVGNGVDIGIVPSGDYWVNILNTRPNRMDFTFRLELSDILYGCMDDDAINYDENANVDDNGCEYNDCNTEWYSYYYSDYSPFILDCNGNCTPAVWVGDGYCDDEIYYIIPSEEAYYSVLDCYDAFYYTYDEGELYECVSLYVNWIDLMCEEFNWDEGDCEVIPGECPEGQIEDCNGNCAPESWLGDGYCDDGSYNFGGNDIFFDCEEFNNDEGDCDAQGRTTQERTLPNGRNKVNQ